MTEKPLLYDVFCGGGGATKGYQRAGFRVIGVDNKPQPRYIGDGFIQMDAFEFFDRYDAGEFERAACFHASPPCQAYSIANNIHGREDHPRLLEPVLERLRASGLPYVVENVERREVWRAMNNPIRLCGLTFGLNVKRHRLFETSAPLLVPPCPKGHPGDWLLVFGQTVLNRGKTIGLAKGGGPRIHRTHQGTELGRQAMGIDWMTRDELSEAIPPQYTEFIGLRLMELI